MSLYEMYGRNENLESQGQKFELAENTFVWLKRFGGSNSGKIAKKHAELTKPYARAIQAGTLKREVEEKIMAKLFSEICFVKMEGVLDREGNPLESNLDNFMNLMMDLPELRITLQGYAEDLSNFQDEKEDAKLSPEEREDLGNS